MYKTGEIPRKGYADPKDVDFVSASEICAHFGKPHPQFVDDGVGSNDCKQGNLGDCWLISAMAALASNDALIIGGRKGMEYDSNMVVD